MIDINNVMVLSYEGEQWKQIPDFPNYLISNMGRIYSGRLNRIDKGTYNEKGYHVIDLSYEKKRKKCRYCRLVAQAFCKGYSAEMEIHHCNLCRSDDRADNLLPVTHEQHKAIHEAIDRFLNDLLETIACYKALSNKDESEVTAA